jgi:hypothetical protein
MTSFTWQLIGIGLAGGVIALITLCDPSRRRGKPKPWLVLIPVALILLYFHAQFDQVGVRYLCLMTDALLVLLWLSVCLQSRGKESNHSIAPPDLEDS